jgi:YHS domain-containing protein
MRRKKKIALSLIVVLLSLLGYSALVNRAKVEEYAHEVGNRFCPVSGKEVDGESSYTHNGKTYNLCSPSCAASLSANPEEFVEGN